MEIPDAMIDTQVQSMMEDFARRMQSQGLSLEQYFQFTGMDAKKMHEQMKPEALKRIQNSLVLEAVAKAENIEISDEKVDEEIAKMAEAYKMEVEKLKEHHRRFRERSDEERPGCPGSCRSGRRRCCRAEAEAELKREHR